MRRRLLLLALLPALAAPCCAENKAACVAACDAALGPAPAQVRCGRRSDASKCLSEAAEALTDCLSQCDTCPS